MVVRLQHLSFLQKPWRGCIRVPFLRLLRGVVRLPAWLLYFGRGLPSSRAISLLWECFSSPSCALGTSGAACRMRSLVADNGGTLPLPSVMTDVLSCTKH